jgi:hypothetical protein
VSAGPRWTALSTALASLLLCACPTGTSLLLEVDTRGVPAQQLHVVGHAGEALVFGPTIRPEHAAELLTREQTLRVLLPDERAEEPVRVRVSALREGAVTGRAEALVTPLRGRELAVPLALAMAPAACARCEGCCAADERCLLPSVAACGAGGVGCFPCDAALADRCTGHGRCACGEGPACSPAAGADGCVGGACRCGQGPACPAGSECQNGLCRCTQASCAGCCAGNECRPGTTQMSCGAGGSACVACAGDTRCQSGACAP